VDIGTRRYCDSRYLPRGGWKLALAARELSRPMPAMKKRKSVGKWLRGLIGRHGG